jgi:hypothetical protein
MLCCLDHWLSSLILNYSVTKLLTHTVHKSVEAQVSSLALAIVSRRIDYYHLTEVSPVLPDLGKPSLPPSPKFTAAFLRPYCHSCAEDR